MQREDSTLFDVKQYDTWVVVVIDVAAVVVVNVVLAAVVIFNVVSVVVDIAKPLKKGEGHRFCEDS